MDHTDYEITLIRSRRKSLAIEITPELQVVVRGTGTNAGKRD